MKSKISQRLCDVHCAALLIPDLSWPTCKYLEQQIEPLNHVHLHRHRPVNWRTLYVVAKQRAAEAAVRCSATTQHSSALSPHRPRAVYTRTALPRPIDEPQRRLSTFNNWPHNSEWRRQDNHQSEALTMQDLNMKDLLGMRRKFVVRYSELCEELILYTPQSGGHRFATAP